MNPPAGSILRAEVVPPYGGDTTFTNLVAAYEGLSGPLQVLAESLLGTDALVRLGERTLLAWRRGFEGT